MMEQTLLFLGAMSAAVAVLVGGARAHVLQGRLSPDRLAMIDVASRYQLIHATGMILVSALSLGEWDRTLLALSGWGFVLGTLLFPVVLYIYAITGQRTWLKVSILGGCCFVGAWLCLALGALTSSA